ncbi:MAG: D-2-hydroxyacid dehydrogenase [Bacteroidia bacterium]|nr:D-2-hydroxyacid dehydrogenase [Bacteroidia bacterium]
MKILANDGIEASAKAMLESNGFIVITEKVPQAELSNYLSQHKISALVVRSATQVTKDIIDACPYLKIIARAGVGTDNIDVEYAKSKGIEVINTPAASSRSVAELVMAHLLGAVRFLHQSNRSMPTDGHDKFNELKKKYSAGREVLGKTLGIIGFGRIGQQVASMALGLGMKVITHDPYISEATIVIPIHGVNPKVNIKTISLEEVLTQSDFITLHVPSGKLIGEKEFSLMKSGVIIINAARGGVIDESALLKSLQQGKAAHACLDVFENEPAPNPDLLRHPNASLSPHIGASTLEAQERIGKELAEKLMAFFEKQHA